LRASITDFSVGAMEPPSGSFAEPTVQDPRATITEW
jgi:hypothetical protein